MYSSVQYVAAQVSNNAFVENDDFIDVGHPEARIGVRAALVAEEHNREDVAVIGRFDHAEHQLGPVGAVHHVVAESGARVEAVADQLDCGGGDGFRSQYLHELSFQNSGLELDHDGVFVHLRLQVRVHLVLIREDFGRQNIVRKRIRLTVIVFVPEAVGCSTHFACMRNQRSPRSTHDRNASICLRVLIRRRRGIFLSVLWTAPRGPGNGGEENGERQCEQIGHDETGCKTVIWDGDYQTSRV